MRQLNEPWTAHVVGRMHRCNITNQELAAACNYSPSYLSSVLHCNKKFRSEESYNITKNRIISCCEQLVEEVMDGRV